MKKLALIIVCLFVGNTMFSQKMMTRTGVVKFEASMPTFEEIAGTNNTTSCIFDKDTGEFVALVLVKSFKFKSPLMEEHFNENYMESSKFPKSNFKGKIVNFDKSKLSATKTTYELEGELTIHGVTKRIKTKIILSTNGEKLNATTNFSVKPADYQIEIPSLVKDKIAKDVKLAISFSLDAK